MRYYNLKLSFRNLWRHKTFSFINIIGLTVGITSCVLIGLYAYQEMSYDKFHLKHKNIYRINKVVTGKEKQHQLHSITPGQLVPAIRNSVPEVEHAALFRPWFTEMLVSYDTVRYKLDNVAYADAGFLKMFDFSLVQGNRNTVLSEPLTAVVTESVVKKYFKDENPIGRTLNTLNNIDVKITGVCRDVPENSSIKFSMLISWSTTTIQTHAEYFSWMNNWLTQVNYSFVQLKANSNSSAANAKIAGLLHQNLPERAKEYLTYLQPLDKIHLYSTDILFAEHFEGNSSKIIYILLVIAAIILLIACFNFINLTTAGALGRAKETGVQKVLGANQKQLIWKYFSESFLHCFIAVFLSVIAVYFVLPLFNDLSGVNISAVLLLKLFIAGGLVLLLILISVLAGLYPAIFLARFRSTDVFRNIIKAGKDNWVRKSLVTTQFALSILLITGTIIVQRQTDFMIKKDLGFDKEQVMVLQLANTGLEERSNAFVDELKQYAGISSISVSNRVPGQTFNGYSIVPEGHTIDEHLTANMLETDTEFDNTYNVSMAEGRYFSPQMPTDTNEAVVINEAMAKFLHWDKAVGKKFEIEGEIKGNVIGVIKDMHITSLREAVSPLAIILKSNPMYLSVKIKPGNSQASRAFIQQLWRQMEPVHPFDYFFMDEYLNKFYKSEKRLLTILEIFAAIAICVACMGLFGLSIYSARQRIKEIGVRKVLGASAGSIVSLLSKDFLKLVIIAAVIASPIAWFVMNEWLKNFAYRTNTSWMVFAISILAAVSIALITISFQAARAALANPVTSLRTE